jgi:hypothetical protein
MWERGRRSMGAASRWKVTCSDSTNRFPVGRWKFAFMRDCATRGSFPELRNCESRSRGILWRRGNILRGMTGNFKFEIGNLKGRGERGEEGVARTPTKRMSYLKNFGGTDVLLQSGLLGNTDETNLKFGSRVPPLRGFVFLSNCSHRFRGGLRYFVPDGTFSTNSSKHSAGTLRGIARSRQNKMEGPHQRRFEHTLLCYGVRGFM